jgi:hypothetical protein
MRDGLRPIVEDYARQAYEDLGSSGFAEFGDEVRIAIVDTAAMYLHDAGYEVGDEVHDFLREVALQLAGTGESR